MMIQMFYGANIYSWGENPLVAFNFFFLPQQLYVKNVIYPFITSLNLADQIGLGDPRISYIKVLLVLIHSWGKNKTHNFNLHLN